MIWRAFVATWELAWAIPAAISDTYDRARRIGRALLPRRREDAFPLSHKAVEHQQEQIRRATTILPPRPQRALCRCGAYHYRQDTNDCSRCSPPR